MFEIEASKDCDRVQTRSHVFIGGRRLEAEGNEMLGQGQARRNRASVQTWTGCMHDSNILRRLVRRSDVPGLLLVAFVELRRSRFIGLGLGPYQRPSGGKYRFSYEIAIASDQQQGGSIVTPRDTYRVPVFCLVRLCLYLQTRKPNVATGMSVHRNQ